MKISSNIQAMNIQANINRANSKLSTLSNNLSTGIKLNSARDDAASYAIATKLKVQITGMEKANKNSLDGVSMAQTLDGALSSMTDMLQRARELAVQASNDTNSQSDREKMQQELDQILAEVDTMQNRVNYNGKKLIGGDASRIVENLDSAGNEQDIAGVTFVSETVPKGELEYDITSPGTPANGQLVLPSGTGAVGTDSNFTINGIIVEFKASDTLDEVNAKTLEAFELAGLSYENGYVYSDKEGTQQEIVFEGDYAVAGVIPGVMKNGTDAVLSNVKYVDENGNEVSSFNDNMVVSANGNDITITSTNEQKIELDINFVGMDASGQFIYGDENNTSKQSINVAGSYVSEVTDYGGITIQTGEAKGMSVSMVIRKINTKELGIDNIKITTQKTASEAIIAFDKALSEVSTTRSEVGAYQNRFEYIAENLDVAVVNLRESLSRLRDTDMAKTMIEYTSEEVKMNAGMSVLQQANERPQSILQLL